MRIRVLFLAVILALWSLSGCRAPEGNQAGQEELRSLTFMAGFKPQANLPFVGVYVAQEKGFFAREGLAVDIQHSAGGGEHLQLLAAGRVEITTQDAAVLLQRRAEPGLPLVSIGLIGQRGQQAFVALADAGIMTPADWVGRRVGYKGTPPPDLLAIMQAAGVNPRQVELINVGFDPRTLTEGLVDVYPVFKSNEPYLLQGWGYELVLWDAADYGVPTLGLTYVTTEKMAAEEPALLAAFMRAATAGVNYAYEHREEAVEIVLRYAGGETNREHMRYMLDMEFEDAITPLTQTYGIGWQTTEQWQALHDMLWEHEALARPIDISDAFTNEFLPGE